MIHSLCGHMANEAAQGYHLGTLARLEHSMLKIFVVHRQRTGKESEQY